MRSVWARLGVFFFLSFGVLAVIPAVNAAAGGGLMDFGLLAAQASAETGIAWTSSLFSIIRLALVEPGLWLLALGSAAPSLAALITIFLFPGRRAALGAMASRFNPLRGSLKRSGLTYLVLFLFLPAGLVAAGLLRDSIGLQGLEGTTLPVLPMLAPAILLSALTDQGALLEEGGWRGFATPLVESRMSPLLAALVVGLGWSLWHLPRDVTGGVIDGLGLSVYLFAYLPSFTLGTLAVSVIASWGMARSGGSVWAAILVHGLVNDAAGLAGRIAIEDALTPAYQITKALPFAVIAVLVCAFDRRFMLRRRLRAESVATDVAG